MKLNQLMWRSLLRVFVVALPLAVLAVWAGQTATSASGSATTNTRSRLRHISWFSFMCASPCLTAP